MYKVTCRQAKGRNCAACRFWNGEGSGSFICDEPYCVYKFSLKRWIKAVFK